MAIIGIDIGGTNIDIGIVDETGKILASGSIETNAHDGPRACMQRIADKANQLIERSPTDRKDIAGIGIGSPGPLDLAAGAMVHCTNFPETWGDFSMTGALAELTSLPVEIDNDANAAALGELWAGGGKGIDDFVVLTLGTGIGGGVVANGRVIRGSKGYGAELGHIAVTADGPKCGCGSRGCLEAYASATGMINMAKQLLEADQYKGSTSPLRDCGEDKLDARVIFDSARAGDPMALEIIAKAGQTLGMAIGTLLNVFNPQKVILAGRMAQSFDVLEPHITQAAKEHAFKATFETATIEASILSANAGLIGAAAVFAYEQKQKSND